MGGCTEASSVKTVKTNIENKPKRQRRNEPEKLIEVKAKTAEASGKCKLRLK